MKLERARAALVIIDVQEKLMPVIAGGTAVIASIEKLVRGCSRLGVPVLVTEQYPQGLGPTVPAIRQVLHDAGVDEPIEKSCFSAGGSERFSSALSISGRRQIILAGVETHVCVYQTAMDLMERSLDLWIVADAVGSRTADNRAIAIERLTREGARLTSVEMVLFELLGVAGTDDFRFISKLVR